jgi:hypothetical protein
MSLIHCVGCDRQTNTAVATYDEACPNVAKGCYAAIVDGEWVKGCVYDQIHLLSMKIAIDNLIANRRNNR